MLPGQHAPLETVRLRVASTVSCTAACHVYAALSVTYSAPCGGSTNKTVNSRPDRSPLDMQTTLFVACRMQCWLLGFAEQYRSGRRMEDAKTRRTKPRLDLPGTSPHRVCYWGRDVSVQSGTWSVAISAWPDLPSSAWMYIGLPGSFALSGTRSQFEPPAVDGHVSDDWSEVVQRPRELSPLPS